MITPLHAQGLPHSLGLLYEDLTAHLGFHRSSDEYKVMALASYGTPRHLDAFRELVRTTEDGGFVTERVDWASFAPPGDGSLSAAHADLAASVQRRLEEVLLDLARWLHDRTGERLLTMAGGTALNCVANSVILRDGPFEDLWVQPAAGDAGTALGAALHVAAEHGETGPPMGSAALGRGFGDDELERALRTARVVHTRPDHLAAAVADELAADRVVAWFQGRAEYGPRALGPALPARPPGQPRQPRAAQRHQGPRAVPARSRRWCCSTARPTSSTARSPARTCCSSTTCATAGASKIPAVVHVDGTARAQTVDPAEQPLLAEVLRCFEERTGLPVLVNTSLNTAGRPIVDSPTDVLELFGSAPVDVLVMGPFLVRRADLEPA